MKINDNYTKVNVENEIKTEGSVFNFYKKMIALRKNLISILVYG
jgi:glycosidase